MEKLSEQIKNHNPYWQDRIIENYPLANTETGRNILEQFAISQYWESNGNINVCDVVGTMHPDYAGKSWRFLLENGKRMVSNLGLLDTNPNYYLENERKIPNMHFVKVNEKLYVGNDGNHRTCIAKFLFDMQGYTTLYGVTIEEYIIDYELYNLYKHLLTFSSQYMPYWQIKPVSKIIERLDTAGWKRDYYQIKIEITNPKNHYSVKITNLSELIDIQKEYNLFLKKFRGKYKMLWV